MQVLLTCRAQKIPDRSCKSDNTQIKEWDIYWIDLGVPIGHEQGLDRPAIIIRYINGICIAIPMTTTTRDLSRFTFTLTITHTDKTNLGKDGVALTFQIRAIDMQRIKNRIGELEPHQIAAIKAQMKELLYITN